VHKENKAEPPLRTSDEFPRDVREADLSVHQADPSVRQVEVRWGGDSRARNIARVNPFRCRVWSLHDRLGDYVTSDSCKSEIQSFQKNGQLVPALGRRLLNDPDCDVELIYGARRLFVAQHLNVLLHVELRELSDREAIIAMDIENRLRRDISPYERGLNYARWLRTNFFQSQDDIARALRVSASQVSRLLKLAHLPSVVVGAFASPLDIREGWGADLLKAWQDPKIRPLIAERARQIAAQSPRAGASEVYQCLMAQPGASRRTGKLSHDIVVSGSNGRPLFRIRRRSDTVALLLPSITVSQRSLDRIRQAVCNVLENEIGR
jgi:ParB family transcriptional regulator, chromosome partitioning protein